LQTRFYVEEDCVKAVLDPREHHCGYINIVHGGVAAAIIDEAMGWAAARSLGLMCYTADLNIRYIKHVPADRPSIITTEVIRANKRLVQVRATLDDESGETYTEAEGRFLPMSPEESLKVDDMLIYRGGEERIFDHLRD
jgi:uncharacterized protein (TIGR00369 family)